MQAQAQGHPAGRGGRRGGGGAPLPKNRGFQRSIAYLLHYRRTAFYAYGALIIANLALLAVPQLIQNMINTVVNGSIASSALGTTNIFQRTTELGALAGPQGITDPKQALTYAQNLVANGSRDLIVAGLIIILFAILRGVFSFVQTYMSEKTSQGVAFDFRNELFAKLQRLSFSYYDQNQTGQLMIRATDDVEKVRLFLGQGMVQALSAVVLLVGSLVLLFATNAQLTLVVLPVLPIAVLLFMGFGIIVGPLFGVLQMKLSRLNTILQENVAGIKVVKAFARETYEQDRYNVSATDLMAQQIRVSRIFSVLFPVTFLVAQLGQVAILYFGGKQIFNNTLTLGQYQSFSLYLVYLFLPLAQLGFIITLAAQAAASAARIFEILDAKNEVADKAGALPLPQVNGTVEFKDVEFRYFGSNDPVLKGVNFVAQPGQTVALLGATGSGKTTIINLLPRFYDVSSGAVLIDGHDVRDVTIDSLRKQIGIVLQETNLFTGSIRDNIAFGRPDATDEVVIEAAKAAAAHDFIMGFPQGYDTPVGERGTTLSGGQKQRIAIARALILDPRILILDDSTSSVDMTTEAKIQGALDRLMKGRTSFVIAQRISTVRNADMILVLDKGQVAASGKHTDLMETSEIYAEIYNSQLMGDDHQTHVQSIAHAGEGTPASGVVASPVAQPNAS